MKSQWLLDDFSLTFLWLKPDLCSRKKQPKVKWLYLDFTLTLHWLCIDFLFYWVSYGSPLWFILGKTKGLVTKTQAAHNEMVCMVAGTFCTAPREALCHLTHMLPMEVYLEKLTFTSALQLHRLPGASQLLHHLGSNWHALSPEDLPLAVPIKCRRQGSCKQHPTASEALASQVPAQGPKINMMIIAPWEVPNWGAQMSIMGACPKNTCPGFSLWLSLEMDLTMCMCLQQE